VNISRNIIATVFFYMLDELRLWYPRVEIVFLVTSIKRSALVALWKPPVEGAAFTIGGYVVLI
jgi:hypothetical protein